MYNTGVEIPKVSFADLSYSGIPINSYFMGFDLDNAGKLSKLDNTGIVTVIEGGSGGGITLTNLSANAPLTYNNVNGAFSITKSTGSTSGYLSSTDWAMFNSKQGSLTLTTTGSSGAATLTGNTLNIPQYSGGAGGITLTSLSANAPLTYNNTTGAFSINQSNGSTNGYLSSTDWTTFNSKIGATSGTNNYVAKFTPNGTTLGNSQIQDDGTKIGISTDPQLDVKINIENSFETGLAILNTNGGIALNGTAQGTSPYSGASVGVFGSGQGNNYNTGVEGSATGTADINKGVKGSASGATINIGGFFEGYGGINNYSLQLQDGTHTVAGRFLKNISDGKANWATITAADVSGVQGALTLTTTGSSGAATLIGNTLNIPQYSGGGGGLTWPAHIEYNETDRTLWVNGKNNNSNNTGFGESTLMSITSATGATGFGRNVLKSLTSGGDNTAVGNNALMSATSGSSTTAIGANALISYTTGMHVVAIGAGAMENAINATNSVAVGSSALWTAVDIDGNTAIGYGAMYANTTGEDNTAVGDRSLFSNTTGSDNVVIGKQAASLMTTGSGNVVIGSLTNVQSGVSNSIVIGRGATSNSSNEFVVGSSFYQAGTIATETITPTRTWKVKINGVDYKIPMIPA